MKTVVFRLECNNGFGHFKRCEAIAKKFNDERRLAYYCIYQDSIDILNQQGTICEKFIFPSFQYPEDDKEFYVCEHLANSMKPGVYVYDMQETPSIAGLKLLHSRGWQVCIIDLALYNDPRYKEYHEYCDAFFITQNHKNKPLYSKKDTNIYAGNDYMIINDDLLKYVPQPWQLRKKDIFYFGGSGDANLSLPKIYASLVNSDLDFIKEYNHYFIHTELSRNKYLEEGIDFLETDNMHKILWNETIYEKLRNARLVVTQFGRFVYECIYLRIPIITFEHHENDSTDSSAFENRYAVTLDYGILAQAELLPIAMQRTLCVHLNDLFENSGFIDGKASERITEKIKSFG